VSDSNLFEWTSKIAEAFIGVALGPVLKSKSRQGCYGAPSILSNDVLEGDFYEAA
jgi:hypothetical protein